MDPSDCLLLLQDTIYEPILEGLLRRKLPRKKHHIPKSTGERVSLSDHCQHSWRKVHLQVGLVGAELGMSSDIDMIRGEGKHASPCNSASPDEAEGREGQDCDSAKE